jgi:hypothetical protein
VYLSYADQPNQDSFHHFFFDKSNLPNHHREDPVQPAACLALLTIRRWINRSAPLGALAVLVGNGKKNDNEDKTTKTTRMLRRDMSSLLAVAPFGRAHVFERRQRRRRRRQ